MMPPDARIPVVLGMPHEMRAGDVLLAEGGHPDAAASFTPVATGHAAGCPCCLPRTSAGRALASLAHRRARAELPFFDRVVAWARTEAGRGEVVQAVLSDPVAHAAFRLSPAAARPGRPGPAAAA